MNKNFFLTNTQSLRPLLAAVALSVPILSFLSCGGSSDEGSTSADYYSSDSGQNITINGRAFSRTSFATVIPEKSSVTIPSEKFPRIGNVFIWDRTVTLNSYEISKYEVTQELYEYVMGSIPHDDSATRYGNDNQKLRPVTGMSWFDAIEFCNKLSELCGYEKVYTMTGISRKNNKSYIDSATVTYDFSKNGYRLPTEAEWEFAARGAGKTGNDWTYEYPGSNNYKKVAWSVLNSSGYSDDDLEIRTHEVGTRQPNSLGLYDMAGNAWEWCQDYWKCKQPGYESTIPKGDTYKYINPVEHSGTFTDPVVDSSQYKSRVIRGGYYGSTIFYLENDCRYFEYQYVCAKNTSTSQKNVGIRLARRK